MSRQVKNAKDIVTGELVYFVSHAKATYLGDGSTVEDTVNVMKRDIKNITLSTEATTMVSVTYEELKNLRDNGELVPGQQYRITDYVTTTTQENTRSAGHQFDIIVTADDVNVLNENARAIQHDGDTYFADSDLNAWQIWYSLDNDAEKFAWADAENGKGVIYRMIDEWGNDCPYDFKNIQFKRFAVTAYNKAPSLVVDNEVNHEGYYYGALRLSGSQVINGATYSEDFVWVHTFALKDLSTETWHDYTILNSIGLKTDESVIITCHSNVIKEHRDEYLGEHGRKAIWLNNIVFFNCYTDISSPDFADSYSYCYANSFENNCESNTFGDNCGNNSFGNNCSSNSFGHECSSNSFENYCESNTFGNDCSSNSFGNNCYGNTFDNSCHYNSFGHGCYLNSFGNGCYNNSFESKCRINSFSENCYYNSFSNGCYSNSFGSNCYSNSFGNNCYYNSFDGECFDNSFGEYCYENIFSDEFHYNSFGNNCCNNTFGNECESNTFENDCYNNTLGISCSHNSFGNECHENSFGNNCEKNSFENACSSNSFGNDCNNNSFSNNCSRNSLGYRCSYNSFGNDCCSNKFGNDCNENSFGNYCMSNTFLTSCDSNSFDNSCSTNNFSDYCKFNKFGNNCYGNTFSDSCTSNSFGTGCYYNSFSERCYHNSFGNNCEKNSFGDNCCGNSFGNYCERNSFDNNSYYNSFGSGCEDNNFGHSCGRNSLSNTCVGNIFGSICYDNSFGNECCYNRLSNGCNYNSFGNKCIYNSFRLEASTSGASLKHCYYNHFDDGCSYNVIWSSEQPKFPDIIKNINVNRGVCGTDSNYNYINIDTINSEKEINVINYNGHIYVDYGDIFKVTYSELVDLRDNSQLIPGRQYRITDYVTTTGQKNTTSAEHKFDIIVTAINEYTLSEDAQAIQNYDEGYFDECDLNSWELKYCLDNDIDRFAWVSREIIENKKIPTNVVYDSSSCSINSNLVNGNEFITPFLPEYYVYIDPIEGGELYDTRQDKSLFYEFGYEVEPNGITENLCIYKSDEAIYQDEGVDYADKFFYRGIKEIDGEEYDYWQKCETSESGTIEFGIFDSNGDLIRDYQYMLTSRIVTGNVEINEYKPLNYIDIDYTIIVDESSSSGDGEPDPDYSANFKLVSYGYELDNNGQKTLVVYKTDTSMPDDPESVNNYRFMPDYEIPCFYVGTEDVDGVTYDKWRVISDWNWDNEDNQKYYLTEQIVENGTIKESAFINYDDIVSDVTFGKPNGTGIIYYMKDEWGNECPYDFKNIKFYNDERGTYVYTFTWIDDSYNVMDTTVFGNNGTLTYDGEIKGVYGNVIKPYMEMIYDEDTGDYLGTKQSLNNITFISNAYGSGGNEGFYGCFCNGFGNNCYDNSFSNNCNHNSFSNNCYNNRFGNYCNYNRFGNNCNSNSFGESCEYNSFGNGCYSNSFGDAVSRNTFENSCYQNSFGNSCLYNSFGNSCTSISFGNKCSNNHFGNNCYQNSFGNSCEYNSFGNGCTYNSFGNSCSHNSFGNSCSHNSFGNSCNCNSFGNYCYLNSFRLSSSNTATLLNYCHYNHFDAGCMYNVIWNSVQPTSSNKLQNINVIRGVRGTSSAYNFINILEKNAAYEIKVAKNSKGDIKVYCEVDLIK